MPRANQSLDGPQPDVMHRIELLISWLLVAGVAASMVTVLVGLGLMFLHHPDYVRSSAELKRLTSPGEAAPHTLADLARGLAAGRGQAVVVLGLLLLIATPVMRVLISLIGFAMQRDWTYALISAIVLAVLSIAFLVGANG